jgi:hypothetical protein
MNKRKVTLLSVLTVLSGIGGFFLTSEAPAQALCYQANWVGSSCGGCMTRFGGEQFCFNYYGSCMVSEGVPCGKHF